MASVRYTLGPVFDPNNAQEFILESYTNERASYTLPVSESDSSVTISFLNNSAEFSNGTIIESPVVSINADFLDNTGPVELIGGSFSDILRTGTGNDSLNGGAGNDVLEGGAGGDRFDGGAGSDTVSFERSSSTVRVYLDPASAANLSGDALGDRYTSVENIRGSDVVSGRQQDDVLVGDGNANVIEGGAGRDYINGGGGGDTASYQHSTAGVAVDLSTGVATGGDAEGDVNFNAIVNLLGSANVDILTGNGQDNVLNGGAGADTLTGGDGSDTYFVDVAGDVVVENGLVDSNNDIIQSSVAYTLTDTQFIETLRLVSSTGTADLDLTGNSFANRLIGNAGDNDLDGGAGADRLEGGRGGDTYYVDDVKDVVIEFANGGNDTVLVDTDLLTYALQQTRAVETLRAEDLTATTALKLYGNSFANTLIGNAGDNVLNGRGGGDTLEGGAGDDIYYVRSGDTVIEESGADGGNDDVIALTSYTLGDGAAVETLRLVSTLKNGSFLIGNAFDQRLVGNASNNTLDGRLGNDVLQGGAGSDSFFFSTALGANNIDTIRDFDAGQDQILLDQDIFANVTTDETGRLSADEFVDIGVAGNTVDGDDSIAYNSKTGELFYVTQGSGGPQLQQFAVLTTHPTLTAQNFSVPVIE